MTPHRKWLKARLKEPNKRISKAGFDAWIVNHIPNLHLDRYRQIKEHAPKRLQLLHKDTL